MHNFSCWLVSINHDISFFEVVCANPAISIISQYILYLLRSNNGGAPRSKDQSKTIVNAGQRSYLDTRLKLM